MRFDSNEIDAVASKASYKLQAESTFPSPFEKFVLPTIHPEIPRSAIISKVDCTIESVAALLIECGIIKPESIPESASTRHDIVKHGLTAWFKKRVGDLKTTSMYLSVIDCQSLSDLAGDYHHGRFPGDGFFLAAVGDSHFLRVLQPKIDIIARHSPRLAITAMHAVYRASIITGDYWLPNEILLTYARWHWEDESLTIPSDEDVKEFLAYEFGEDDIPPDSLPSRVIPTLGGLMCLNRAPKRKLLNRTALKRYARSDPHPLVRSVAKSTATLLKSVRRAERRKATLSDDGFPFLSREQRGMVLVYEVNALATYVIDSELQNAAESGEGTDIIGFRQLPTNTVAMATLFKNMNLVCQVIKELDELVQLISDEYKGE